MKNCLFILLAIIFCLNARGQASSAKVEDTTIYSAVEVSPQFPGGEEAFGKYLQKNIRLPENSRDTFTGTIVFQWIVESDGSISHIEILRGVPSNQQPEMVKILRSMPKWFPGRQKGKVVRVKYIVPMHICFGDF